jgi:hypothetical protein
VALDDNRHIVFDRGPHRAPHVLDRNVFWCIPYSDDALLVQTLLSGVKHQWCVVETVMALVAHKPDHVARETAWLYADTRPELDAWFKQWPLLDGHRDIDGDVVASLHQHANTSAMRVHHATDETTRRDRITCLATAVAPVYLPVGVWHIVDVYCTWIAYANPDMR